VNRFHPNGSDEAISQPDEAIFGERQHRPETIAAHNHWPLIKQRGSVMVAVVLNAIYRRFLKNVLPGMARQGALR
jgi:hypothetical protein